MSAETFHEEPQVLDTLVAFDEDRSTNELIIKRTQHIPDDFISDLRKEKVDSVNQKAGEFYKVASIPVEVCDELLRRYGFDVFTAPVRETLKMLQRYELDVFITTNKRIWMFAQYRRKQIAELRPWVDGDLMVGISVSAEDRRAGSPKAGDMIARNPKNHADQWLVAAAYFADNFEPV